MFEQNLDTVFKQSIFEDKSVELVKNTPQELRDHFVETVDRIQNKWVENKKYVDLQKNFWSTCEKYIPDLKNLNSKPIIGSKFLEKNEFLLNN